MGCCSSTGASASRGREVDSGSTTNSDQTQQFGIVPSTDGSGGSASRRSPKPQGTVEPGQVGLNLLAMGSGSDNNANARGRFLQDENGLVALGSGSTTIDVGGLSLGNTLRNNPIEIGTNLKQDRTLEETTAGLSVGYVTIEPKPGEVDDKIKAVGLRAALNAILYDDEDDDEDGEGMEGGMMDVGVLPGGNTHQGISKVTDVSGGFTNSGFSDGHSPGIMGRPVSDNTKSLRSPSSKLHSPGRSPAVLQSFEDHNTAYDDDSDGGSSVTSSHAVDGRTTFQGKKGKQGKDGTVIPVQDQRQMAVMMATPSNAPSSKNSSASYYSINVNPIGSRAKSLGNLRRQVNSNAREEELEYPDEGAEGVNKWLEELPAPEYPKNVSQ